jgi:GTP cyclohydrolase I
VAFEKDDLPDDIELEPQVIEMARQLLYNVAGSAVDWESESLVKTPERFAKALHELTTPKDDWHFTTFPNEGQDQMVVVAGITFVALCEHHVLPFSGACHVAYIPGERLAGLSKFARAVRFWARGLWTQEELTEHIADYLHDMLDPRGLAVVMEAEHTCMTIRGVQAPGTLTVTSSMKGLFIENEDHPERIAAAREEFWQHVNRSRRNGN